MTRSDAPTSFRIAFVPGVTPDKWARIWRERSRSVGLSLIPTPNADAETLIRNREVDAALLRLPIDRTGLHAIPLYTETTVVVVGKDHFVTAADTVSADDLADEIVLHPLDDTLDWEHPPGRPAIQRPDTTGDAVELVAAGVGVLVVPMSLARLHHRKDLTYRPISDVPESQVALSWLADETTDLMELFIGIVRGRTVNSTRGRQQNPTAAPAKSTRDAAGRKPSGGGSAGKGGNRGSGRPQRGNRGNRRRRS